MRSPSFELGNFQAAVSCPHHAMPVFANRSSFFVVSIFEYIGVHKKYVACLPSLQCGKSCFASRTKTVNANQKMSPLQSIALWLFILKRWKLDVHYQECIVFTCLAFAIAVADLSWQYKYLTMQFEEWMKSSPPRCALISGGSINPLSPTRNKAGCSLSQARNWKVDLLNDADLPGQLSSWGNNAEILPFLVNSA